MGYKLKRILIYPDGVTEKQVRPNATPITTSGIYHNATLGLISLSSDGSTWITIADKNLGATAVYNDGDTLSEANCGKYYQRGNNYGFPRTGSVTTSSTKVNAQNYGPGNYYNSSTFIKAYGGRDSSNNNNLRGGVTGTNTAMQGPCPVGYHIPTINERSSLRNLGVALGAWSTYGGSSLKTYLKLPYAGYRDGGTSNIYSQGGTGYYNSSSYYDTSYSYMLYVSGNNINDSFDDYRSAGASIRPFKNDAVQPDSSRTKLY